MMWCCLLLSFHPVVKNDDRFSFSRQLDFETFLALLIPLSCFDVCVVCFTLDVVLSTCT